MGRPRLWVGHRQFILRVDPRLLKLLDDAADKEGLSRNTWISMKLAEIVHGKDLRGLKIPMTSSTGGMKYHTDPKVTMPAKGTLEYGRRLRARVIEGYGGKCSCPTCGESRSKMLTINHVNGYNGRRGTKLHSWIVRHNFPPEYRILCFNCNLGRAVNSGVCPHVADKPSQVAESVTKYAAQAAESPSL